MFPFNFVGGRQRLDDPAFRDAAAAALPDDVM
jgi:hypothetical protein